MKKITFLLLGAAFLLGAAGCTSTEKIASFSVSCDSAVLASVPATGGTYTLTATWANCKFRVSADASFVTLPSYVYVGDVSGSGSRDLEITVAPNTSSASRTAVLSFTQTDGEPAPAVPEVTVVQAGVPKVTASVTLSPGTTYQSWDGFGAMNGWGSSDYWTSSETDLLMKSLGLNIMRVRIPSSKTNWKDLLESCAYVNDTYGGIVLASPWTMPAEWKTTGSLNGKTSDAESHLLAEHYGDYALYLEEFASYMKESGAPVYAVSVQNEPDWPAEYEGCVWTADEHLAFVRDYGSLVKSALLVTGESMSSKHSFYDPVLKDETACGNIDIVGGHLYGAKPQSYSLASDKGKRLWMTEHLLNENWSDWSETMDMATEILQCLTTGWNAYIWWYGRRYYSLIGDGAEGTSKGTILKRGHAFGQFSRYIRPGDVRIGVSLSGADGISATAFRGSDHTVVLLLNTTGSDKDVTVDMGSSASGAEATCTTASSSAAEVALTVQGNRVELSLPSKSITSIRM